MSRTRHHWIIGISILTVALFSVTGRVASAEEGLKQEAAPAEGEVGTRAMPMQKQRELSPFRSPMLQQSDTAPAPPSPATPPTCVKQLFDSSFVIQQPILPTQYYSMTSSVLIRTRSNRAYFSEFDLTAQELAGVSQPEDIAFAPLHLPHGATIRELIVVLYDSSGKDNLQVTLSRRMGDQPQRAARLMTFESDCVLKLDVASMGASNLAIPFDGRYAYVLKFSVVPSQALTASLANPVVAVFEVRIGYTVP